MSPHSGTPLEQISGFPQQIRAALQASWITTAEQFVASTAAVGGASQMAKHLGFELSELQSALEKAEAIIPPAELQEMKSPVDTSRQGLGAKRPKEPPQ